MSENKKYLGMEKNVCFGLSWVLFPFAIVTLAVEKELTTEEKRNLVSSIVVAAIGTIISTIASTISSICRVAEIYDFGWTIGILGIIPFIFWLIGLIKNFKGEHEWQCPFAYSIACMFVKDDGTKKEEPVEAEVIEIEDDKEVEEEKKEE